MELERPTGCQLLQNCNERQGRFDRSLGETQLLRLGGRLIGKGQRYGGAAAQSALNRRPAAVQIDNRSDQGQPETGAGWAAGGTAAIKTGDHAWQMLLRDARAGSGT